MFIYINHHMPTKSPEAFVAIGFLQATVTRAALAWKSRDLGGKWMELMET
jgi:hypothetical protein